MKDIFKKHKVKMKSLIIILIIITVVVLPILELLNIKYADPIILNEYEITGEVKRIDVYGYGRSSVPTCGIVFETTNGDIYRFEKSYNYDSHILAKKQYSALRNLYEGQKCTLVINEAVYKTMIFKIPLKNKMTYLVSIK